MTIFLKFLPTTHFKGLSRSATNFLDFDCQLILKVGDFGRKSWANRLQKGLDLALDTVFGSERLALKRYSCKV